ncbi:protein kinase [Streptomyces sp. NPDC051742]|uniref:protein kinase n=1 Tax=unclassified Streptomyces TaxID=2593676 RepID=UPI0034487F4A
MAQGARSGQVIGGRYRLVSELRSGGFGRAWKARDETLRIDVAVKESWLFPMMSETERAQRPARAAREARNAARLRDHPNIVGVHDVVIEDRLPWIVMQLVDGCSLEERLDTRDPCRRRRPRVSPRRGLAVPSWHPHRLPLRRPLSAPAG